MLLIGDCHGLTTDYADKVKYIEGDGIHSILLGEMGFKQQHDWFINSPYSKQNKILFGNHDYFPYLNKSYSLGRFSPVPEYDMFAIAGAFSIDRVYRTEGRDWFREEEMSIGEEIQCLQAYKDCKPEIVISHDAPASVVNEIFHYSYTYPDSQKTNKFLDRLLENHKPRVWVFAHHHDSRDKTINGTRFICLDELETIKVESL